MNAPIPRTNDPPLLAIVSVQENRRNSSSTIQIPICAIEVTVVPASSQDITSRIGPSLSTYAWGVAQSVQEFVIETFTKIANFCSYKPDEHPSEPVSTRAPPPLPSPKSPGQFTELNKEIVSVDPRLRLRRAAIQEKPSNHSEENILAQQMRSAQFISEFFIKSYSDLPQRLAIHQSQSYEPLLQTFKSMAIASPLYKTVPSLQIKEQLSDLQMLCGRVTGDREDIKRICDYSLSIATCEGLSIASKKSIIGKMIFLMDANYSGLYKAIQISEIWKVSENIDELFRNVLDKMSMTLNLLEMDFLKTPFQDGQRAKCRALTKILGKALVPHAGIFNSAIAIELIHRFLTPSDLEQPAASHMYNALKTIMNSDTLRDKLGTVCISDSPDSPACNLVRVSLDMPYGSPITNTEAQQACLEALLSFCRQGKSGTCFASFLTIELMASNLELCLDDFAALLRSNCLYRDVGEKRTQFPFRLSMSKERLHDRYTADLSGRMTTEHFKARMLWEAPGILAAIQAAGLDKPQEAIVAALHHLMAQKTDLAPFSAQAPAPISFSIDELLKALAAISAKKHIGAESTKLYLNAMVAYESQTYNPLLRVWESVIAGMAEGADNGYIKPQIIDSIMFALERKLAHALPSSPDLELYIAKILKDTLQRRIQLQFCPQIEHQGSDDDGNSQQGAFVVYDTQNASFSEQWEPIDNPSKFQLFIQAILKEVKEKLEAAAPNRMNLMEPAMQSLLSYIQRDDFIIQTIKKCGYHHEKHPLINFDKIDNTPWMFKTGTNPKKVLQIYFELEHPPFMQPFMMHDAQQLLSKVVEISAKHFFWITKSTKSHILLPAAIQGIHVFSLMPKHPTLWPIIEHHEDVGRWLQEKVLLPCKKISCRTLPSENRNRIVSAYASMNLPSDKQAAFIQHAALIRQDLTTKEFRDELLKIVIECAGKEIPLPKLVLDIDTLLFEHLPDPYRKALSQSAIHFADTNWYDSNRAIHFCIIGNPGSGQLEVWKINSDNSRAIPLEQNYWLLAHNWEFYP